MKIPFSVQKLRSKQNLKFISASFAIDDTKMIKSQILGANLHLLSIKSIYSENHLFGDIPALYYISYSTVHVHKVSKNETSQIGLQAPMGTCPKADTTTYSFFFS